MKTIFTFIIAGVMTMSFQPTHAQVQETKNNMILLPVTNDPTISFRLWFKVGAQDDPAGKEGLAALTGAMLTDASTQTNSYEQILDKLYPLAANYDVSASMEMTVVHGRTHKDNLNEYYPLFVDALLRPAFKQEDLDRINDRPQAGPTLRFGRLESPNACLTCHEDQDGKWLEKNLREWRTGLPKG